jgi:tyrosinase co-factor MelC1
MTTIDRRGVLRLGLLGLTALGTSVGVAQLAAARGPTPDPGSGFAELYRGRRIRGLPGLLPRVFVDDVELHLMPMGTAGYSTHVNHYQVFRTPRLAARAAVTALDGARLLPVHR